MKLWSKLEADWQRFGFYCAGEPGGGALQAGVVRTNCIDCLDRTNVVQVNSVPPLEPLSS